MSVINKLSELYPNISYTCSGHQLCPKCGGKQFSITKDDSLGLCFSASCSYRIFGNETKFSQVREMQINQEVFKIFNSKFLENKNGNAYAYCKNSRLIHEKVLENAFIGEICNLPKELLNEIETLHATVLKNIEQITLGRKEDDYKNNETLKALTNQEKSLQKFLDFFKNLQTYIGWLVFAYTDEKLNICSFNLRKPFTKVIASFKPFERKGVFGLNLMGEFLERKKNKKMVVVEGEYNVLQLYSCLERDSVDVKTVPIIGIGGAQSPDIATIKAIQTKIYLCRDNDSAGKTCESKFAEHFNFYSFTTPTKDLDEYLKPNPTKTRSLNEVQDLIDSADFIEMVPEKTVEMVNQARDGNNHKAHRKNQLTAEIAISDLFEKGKLYKSNGRYFFLRYRDRLIYQISSKDESFGNLLISLYKINPSESIYSYLISELMNVANYQGIEVKTAFYTYYNKTDNTLFLYDFKDVVYLIKADGTVNKLKNGDRNILFLQSRNSSPFKIDLNTKYSYSPLDSFLFKDIFLKGKFKVTENSLTHRENAILMMYFFYTFLFMNKFNTKPIVSLIGEKGSGKTTICKLIGKLVFGNTFDVVKMPNKEGDFDALITNGSFHVLDNVDSTPDWLMDKLAIIATGGDMTKRKLYSDNTTCDYSLDCMLAITSRTPKFNRDDIADRILPLYFERLQEQGFLPEGKMIEDLLAKRDIILSEIIGLHIPLILQTIDEFNNSNFRTSFRMAEFAEFATMISKKLGIIDEHNHIFEILEKSQKEFALRDSPLFELLETYTKLKKTSTQKNTTFEIFKLLESHLAYNGNKMPFNSTQQFTAHFTNNLNTLKEEFTIEVTKGRSNRTMYCISKISCEVLPALSQIVTSSKPIDEMNLTKN